MQFCAELVGEVKAGARVTVAVVTRNISLDSVAAISLVNIPSLDRSQLLAVYPNRSERLQGKVQLRREYVVHLVKGDCIRAIVETRAVAHAGRNELFIEVPYWVPTGPPFSPAEIAAFHEQSWPAPELIGLIGPLVFNAK